MGLREEKKLQTRSRLTETAWRLASDRGFDQVTVAEVARAAEVAEATVFNYFRSKEDLFYAPLETFGDRLVEAVRGRDAGTAPLDAVRGFVLGSGGLLTAADHDPDSWRQLQDQTRVITESPALLAREHRAFARTVAELADQLVAEGDDPVIAAVVAHALVGVQRSLISYVREQVLGRSGRTGLARQVRARANRAFSLLEEGLGRYRDAATEGR